MLHGAVVLVHLLAAIAWTGGTIALVFAAVPAIRTLEGEPRALALRTLGQRWRPLGWGAFAVLVATGIWLARADGALDGDLFDTAFGRVLLVKSLLVALLATGAYLHDFVLGPRLAAEVRAGGAQPTRPTMVRLGWTTFALTIAVPLLGAALTLMGEP